MTFPLLDMGAPIPGTTNLREPPEGPLPPPPPRMPSTTVHKEIIVAKELECQRTTQHYARMLFNSLKVVTGQAETLNAREIEENENNHAPLPVLMVHEAQA